MLADADARRAGRRGPGRPAGGLIDIDILIGAAAAMGRGIGPEALCQLFRALRDRGTRWVGLATCLANRRALGACTRAGPRPYRDFEEAGEAYRYFTQRLDEAA